MWQADAGEESGWGEQDSEDGHGRENAVPDLANGSRLPPPWGDYNPASCRYWGFRVGWMEAKEGCLPADSSYGWFYLSLAGPGSCGHGQHRLTCAAGANGVGPILRTGKVQGEVKGDNPRCSQCWPWEDMGLGLF